MDTKSKKFSRSRAVKVLLVALYIICFGAIGIISGYSPAHRYADEGAAQMINNMFCDNFEDTRLYSEAIGMSQSGFDNLKAYWAQVRRNLWIIAVSDLCLFAVGIVLMCLLCCVSGEETDGTEKRGKLLFYEVPIAVIAALAVPYYVMMVFGVPELQKLADYSVAGNLLYMILAGMFTVGYALVWLYLAVSLAERKKTKTLWKGSLVIRVLVVVVKGLGWCGSKLFVFFRFIKELFTGELYKGKTAKRLILIDCTFIAYSCFVLIILLLGLECPPPLALFFELIGAGFFFYGRFLLVRDAALLERQINEIYNGNYTFEEKLSKNSPYTESADKLRAVANQYRKGLEESVKAERMKIELVTNVSHDLKTPLTSIISYIDLLSKEELSPAAEDYVRVLQQKSQRLKNIVSDVFELAKTTSGEIEVAREQLDLSKLSWQTLGEMEDRIKNSGLILRTKICEPPVTIVSDGKRIYRIIQNLMDNALKYSLNGTRIYYTLEKKERTAVISIKNIAAYEMEFTTDEILERFTRGDKSRTTEGSGLGLSIAQGFALACGGDFGIEIDGDMFKATLSFPLADEPVLAKPVVFAAPAEQPKTETVTTDE